MSYRGCPLQFLPPGARPGENLRRGDISIGHEDVIQEVLPPADEEALEMASRMRYVRIPERGSSTPAPAYRAGVGGMETTGYSAV